MSECVIDDKGEYYQITEFDLEGDDFHNLFSKVEIALKEKKQDVLLSLASVGILYSSHLAMLVRMHQSMHKHNQRFVLSDISAEIRNLLQITQLDSIFSIYETVHDFENSLKTKDDRQALPAVNFEWQILKNSDDTATVICKGDMVIGEQLDELQKNILDFFNITFDFSELQSMDSASVTFLERLADKNTVSITGANEKLIDLFNKRFFYGRVKIT